MKASYHYITSTSATSDRFRVDDIWFKHISSKVSLLVWRLLRNRLLTKDNLVRRGILLPTDGACAAGCDNIESASHLFLHCVTYSQVWSNVRNWLGIYSTPSGELQHHFIQFTKMAGMPRTTHLFLTVIWFATVWVIWKKRNNRVFQNTISNPSILTES